jgi:hypothetical protein
MWTEMIFVNRGTSRNTQNLDSGWLVVIEQHKTSQEDTREVQSSNLYSG